MAANVNSNWAPLGPRRAQPAEPENALEVGEQHLDALSITARLLECFGLCHCPGNIAGWLVEAARDSAAPALSDSTAV